MIGLFLYMVAYPVFIGAGVRLFLAIVCELLDCPMTLYKDYIYYLVTATAFVLAAMFRMNVLVTVYTEGLDWLGSVLVVVFWAAIFNLVVVGQLLGDCLVGRLQEESKE